MNKIPTLFVRGDNFGVTDEVTPGCEWVLAGEGIATEKLDGTNVCVLNDGALGMTLLKRQNPSKEQKAAGVDPSYVAANRDDPADKHIYRALDNTLGAEDSQWPRGVFHCEAVGPKIQGNPLGLETPTLVCFEAHNVTHAGTATPYDVAVNWGVPMVPRAGSAFPRSYDELRSLFLSGLSSMANPTALAEGAVFQRIVDGVFEYAKIKARDFR